jgi:predicted transcriptional regulator
VGYGSEVPPKVRMPDLFFELASDDRLALLTAIGAKKQRATQLAGGISATIQEVSKHLSRIQGSGLVEKDRDGYFHLTPVGTTVVHLLPSFRFLTENMDYFLEHDLTLLPPEFVGRIGELSDCGFAGYTGLVLAFYEQVVKEAEEYVCVMMDHQVRSGKTIAGFLAERHVRVRYMVPEGSDISEDYHEAEKLLGELLEVRLSTTSPCVGLMFDEKRAGIAFADVKGRVDYNSGFTSADPRFHGWCRDLFEFHWKRARRVGMGRPAPGARVASEAFD